MRNTLVHTHEELILNVLKIVGARLTKVSSVLIQSLLYNLCGVYAYLICKYLSISATMFAPTYVAFLYGHTPST